MDIIRIYDISEEDNMQILVDKLKLAGADIERYSIISELDRLEENEKIRRLYSVYGNEIFPVTVINGDIVKVENHLELKEIVAQTGLSMKKIAKVGIEINCGLCNNTNTSCSGCGCSKSGCSTCDSKNQCHKNKIQE